MWTRFMDMHSGGSLKEPQQYIYIEAERREAELIFQNRFGHNPYRVTCTCCGEDYSIDESETLEQASCFERGCAWEYVGPEGQILTTDDEWFELPHEERVKYKGRHVERPKGGEISFLNKEYKTVEEYVKSDGVLVIRAADIKPEERVGSLREEGYVWR